MGSGGPRGLQILLSGGSPVRGGFDSHPFPPLLAPAIVALALIVGAGAVRAQAPDTTATPRLAARDTVSRGVERHRPFFSSPTGVMLRSLAVPGWGQASNGAWLKAALVAGGETAIAVSLVRDSRKLSKLTADDPGYAAVFDRRQREAWWLGGVVFLSMVDAYVDAHLKGFDVQLGPEPGPEEIKVSARIALP